jgi:hypothetical protein
MRLSVTGRSLRLAGWAVPILALLSCAPSVARASCGDYVVMRGPHAEAAMPPGPWHSAEAPVPVRPDPHKPCSGPNCSRGPVVPSLPAPTVGPPAPHEWGSLTGPPAFAAPGHESFLFESSPSQPIRLTRSIFHPPRRAA